MRFALAGLAVMLAAADAPPTMPLRDVDVTYSIQDAGRPGTPALTQRLRWGVAQGKLRVDPPVADIYVVLDMKAHTLDSVRVSRREVMRSSAAGMRLPGEPAPGAPFRPGGADRVAGLDCTVWETQDSSGVPALACITADGVLLKAVAAGRMVVEATRVEYAPQDPAVFAIPPGYREITPAPVKPQAP